MGRLSGECPSCGAAAWRQTRKDGVTTCGWCKVEYDHTPDRVWNLRLVPLLLATIAVFGALFWAAVQLGGG